jgi:hypothetical protein
MEKYVSDIQVQIILEKIIACKIVVGKYEDEKPLR